MTQNTPASFDSLEPNLLDTVKQMLLTGDAYSDVADYLSQNSIPARLADISAFAASLNADVAALRTAQNALRGMLQEVERQPNLDAAEALLRMVSQHLLHVLSQTDDADWANMDKAKLLSSTIGLVNAATHKKRADYAIQQITETGIDAVKNNLFHALSAERPELYNKLAAFLDQKKETIQGTA